MHFEYEITSDEFVAGHLLYNKINRGRKRFQITAACIVTGLALLFVAWREKSPDSGQIIVVALGALWIYVGFRMLFPAWLLRRAYLKSNLAGKKFAADANEDGFEVKGDLYSWHVRWPGVRLKAENKQVFMLSSQGTIFMFGKKYLTNDQQQELRRLSGLASPSGVSVGNVRGDDPPSL